MRTKEIKKLLEKSKERVKQNNLEAEIIYNQIMEIL